MRIASDPSGVLAVMQSLGNVRVTGPHDNWTEAVLSGPKRFLRRAPQLVIAHNASYYRDRNWHMQLTGMANYFANFPDVPGKVDILQAIGNFRFALSFPEMDLDVESDDPRLAWLFAICQHLDGVLFTPSALRDARGRILIAADGEYDPEAALPKVPSASMLAMQVSSQAQGADNGDEEIDVDPPTALRVARRALVLCVVTNRGLIENEPTPDAEEIRLSMLEFLAALDLGDEVEPEEWKVLQRPVGRLDEQSVVNACWRLEGLGVLLWALGKETLPPYDELVNPAELYEAVGIPDVEAAREFMNEAALRSSEKLEEYSKTALAAHWRLRDFSLRREAMDFVAFSKKCWFGSFDLAPFRVVRHDLAIGEFSIADASDDALSSCMSSAMERHLAINWLRGDSTIYSQTDTST